MDGNISEALRQLISQYGVEIERDPRRLRSLLSDICPDSKREVNLLLYAIEEKIPEELASTSSQGYGKIQAGRFAQRLIQNRGITQEAANWTVNCWGYALGIATDAVLERSPLGSSTDSLPEPKKIIKDHATQPDISISMDSSKTPSLNIPEQPISYPKIKIPAEVKEWSWGAFSLTFIWGAFNGVWISFLFSILSLIPFLGIIFPIILGIYGKRWAWENSKHTTVEDFLKVQRKWDYVGKLFFIILPNPDAP